eukprot:TRINITY_DN39988_c0_g1_i1.p1 TRINITY_DN39988_c0_g1~~TRINITY_DN39988_c0_g1_i1.p1  ORF type:complete len:251 (-),score=33.26 TRINITY_DN39988_c0_g1_i1:247-906(-)
MALKLLILCLGASTCCLGVRVTQSRQNGGAVANSSDAFWDPTRISKNEAMDVMKTEDGYAYVISDDVYAINPDECDVCWLKGRWPGKQLLDDFADCEKQLDAKEPQYKVWVAQYSPEPTGTTSSALRTPWGRALWRGKSYHFGYLMGPPWKVDEDWTSWKVAEAREWPPGKRYTDLERPTCAEYHLKKTDMGESHGTLCWRCGWISDDLVATEAFAQAE